MGIVSGDGYHYYNEKGIEITSYIDAENAMVIVNICF